MAIVPIQTPEGKALLKFRDQLCHLVPIEVCEKMAQAWQAHQQEEQQRLFEEFSGRFSFPIREKEQFIAALKALPLDARTFFVKQAFDDLSIRSAEIITSVSQSFRRQTVDRWIGIVQEALHFDQERPLRLDDSLLPVCSPRQGASWRDRIIAGLRKGGIPDDQLAEELLGAFVRAVKNVLTPEVLVPLPLSGGFLGRLGDYYVVVVGGTGE